MWPCVWHSTLWGALVETWSKGSTVLVCPDERVPLVEVWCLYVVKPWHLQFVKELWVVVFWFACAAACSALSCFGGAWLSPCAS
jgi:hypothetical protein